MGRRRAQGDLRPPRGSEPAGLDVLEDPTDL